MSDKTIENLVSDYAFLKWLIFGIGSFILAALTGFCKFLLSSLHKQNDDLKTWRDNLILQITKEKGHEERDFENIFSRLNESEKNEVELKKDVEYIKDICDRNHPRRRA